MSKLDTFKKEFDYRHDFEDSDMQLLCERHSDIQFSNIPAAWILPVDEMLCKFKYNEVAKAVRQEYGQLVVVLKSRPADQGRYSKYRSIVDECEQKLKSIDMDLHICMEIDRGKNGS